MIYNSTKRIHNSKVPIKKLWNCKLPHKPYMLFKPVGLWYSVGNEWEEWCRSEMPGWIGKYNYELDIKNINLLRLDSVESILEFNKLYSLNTKYNYEVDWGKLYSLYDGIEITPYQYNLRYELGWYYSWDVASGCIWNAKKIVLTSIK